MAAAIGTRGHPSMRDFLGGVEVNGYRRDIAEPASLEQAWSENITFGVNSSAAFAANSKNGATDYPWCKGPARMLEDCR